MIVPQLLAEIILHVVIIPVVLPDIHIISIFLFSSPICVKSPDISKLSF